MGGGGGGGWQGMRLYFHCHCHFQRGAGRFEFSLGEKAVEQSGGLGFDARVPSS